MKSGSPILLVEDDKVDQLSVKRVMNSLGIVNPLLIAKHGEEALEILQNSKPSLILLDLNMPRMNGLEFLKMIKADENINAIPVIVVTTSNSAEERLIAFRLGVCGFMIKPVEFDDFVRMFDAIKKYWTLSESPY